nr:RNA-directed DNA polymerase, eukaryota [Tanacetum cinerariifolium]
MSPGIRPSTPPNYSSGSSRNAECSNYKHLLGKISVLKAAMNMHMHPEQHTVNSAALLHEVHKDGGGEDDTIANDVEKEKTPPVHANITNTNIEVTESSIGESTSIRTGHVHNGGSILDVLEDMVRVGHSMGYNLEGCMKDIESLGHKSKKEWIKELNSKPRVNFLALQETKLERVSHMDVKLLWGNFNFQFISSDSNGSSGGILCVWETSVFKKDNATVSDNFIAIYGTWLPSISKILFVVVYAPQQLSMKRSLWDYITSLLRRWNGDSIVMGDFNDVRCKEERLGSLFNPLGARLFNQFINSSGLVEVKMEGYSFTWSHPSASKMSKLDRFLVTEGLHGLWSDSFPFLSFMISAGWELGDIDKILDHGNIFDTVLLKRMELMLQLHDLNQVASRDAAQKSKIKWAIDGDENSKFFHGIINMKRSYLSIRGVFVDGIWCTDPVKVKDTFKDHFQARFEQPSPNRFKLSSPFPKWLSHDQVVDIDSNVSRNEIRRAVWDCGDNKSSGPDGYSFEFFRKYWSFIGPDFCCAVEHFFKHGSFSKGCNSSFIALIPKVSDAKFVSDFRPISLIGCVYKTPKGVLKEMEAIRSKFFNGADTSKRKIKWIAWQKDLASKIHGGLGISSFYALNRALLLKWVWRFISHDGSLWSKVIQAIYSASFELHSSKQVSLWCSILREVHSLKAKGFDFISHCKKRAGDGLSTRFWLDIWVFELPPSKRFPRLFMLDMEKEDLSLVGFGWAELDVVFELASVVSFHSASL